ncbi:DNA polymerase III subunit beta [Marinicrinis lubricantis]|uniref:Beta sliding clamp n=1 Tax=Marinicrinis lubricantis TaxID=2086470 RepID=A0ABW1IH42_9BACL
MKLKILKNELNESIQHVSKAVSSRTTIPILSGIKIDANASGITLTASDTDISIQSFIPTEKDGSHIIQLETQGSVVLPAKFFVEIIKKLPDDEVEIEVKDQFQTWIRSGKSEIHMIGLDPEEYPLLPQLEQNETFTVQSDLLKSMIRQTLFCVSTNESTPILTGVQWQMAEGKLKLIATDRHRLATRQAQIPDVEQLQFKNIVISGKNLNELNKILPDQNEPVQIVVAESQVLFKIDTNLFYTRILDGLYPDTSKIIPQSFKTEMVISTKSLLNAVDRAYLLSREEKTNIVRLVAEESGLVEISSSQTELGKIKEEIETESYSGEAFKISFNSKYMLDALKAMDCEKIHIGFTGAMSPIVLKPSDHVELVYVILPYRTTG